MKELIETLKNAISQRSDKEAEFLMEVFGYCAQRQGAVVEREPVERIIVKLPLVGPFIEIMNGDKLNLEETIALNQIEKSSPLPGPLLHSEWSRGSRRAPALTAARENVFAVSERHGRRDPTQSAANGAA